MQNIVVFFFNIDKFVLMQDMCVVCGSFGWGVEGYFFVCLQCFQCYYFYCVNSKIIKVMLFKGWCCVECIVCEVCGQVFDFLCLLFCDDCDISYYIYCLDFLLFIVFKGGWKCKWCVFCMQCGVVFFGFYCEWQNSYIYCGFCVSLVICFICYVFYVEEDLLIQCCYCEWWMYVGCESFFIEDDVEQVVDEGFDCVFCQFYVVKFVVFVVFLELVFMKVKELEFQYFCFEGVWLIEIGMVLLCNLIMLLLYKWC